MLVCFNLSDAKQSFSTAAFDQLTEQTGHKLATATFLDNTIELPAFACFYGEIK
jgi:hypothetical protein